MAAGLLIPMAERLFSDRDQLDSFCAKFHDPGNCEVGLQKAKKDQENAVNAKENDPWAWSLQRKNSSGCESRAFQVKETLADEPEPCWLALESHAQRAPGLTCGALLNRGVEKVKTKSVFHFTFSVSISGDGIKKVFLKSFSQFYFFTKSVFTFFTSQKSDRKAGFGDRFEVFSLRTLVRTGPAGTQM